MGIIKFLAIQSNALRHTAAFRLLASIVVAAIVFELVPSWSLKQTRPLLAWDIGALTYLMLAWAVISKSDAESTRRHAESFDTSGYVMFVLVVVAAVASTFAIGFMAGAIKGASLPQRSLHVGLSLLALVAAWLLIHTIFAFHYAHRYYGGPSPHDPGGITFPGGLSPDYWDFAYYSFVVGMTSQVSDSAVTSRPMRRLTLVHGVLSFLFNLTELALSINIVAGAI